MTTILCVRKKNRVVMAGDGQVSMQNTIMKPSARKLRNTFDGKVIAGFAGSTADAFTLFEKFESKIDEYEGNLTRAVVELAKEWRTDKYLRNLKALLALMDKRHAFIVSGDGNVIEPDGPIIAIGSGGGFAQAAATAFIKSTTYPARKIVEKSLQIAADLCIYTNDSITVMEIK